MKEKKTFFNPDEAKRFGLVQTIENFPSDHKYFSIVLYSI